MSMRTHFFILTLLSLAAVSGIPAPLVRGYNTSLTLGLSRNGITLQDTYVRRNLPGARFRQVDGALVAGTVQRQEDAGFLFGWAGEAVREETSKRLTLGSRQVEYQETQSVHDGQMDLITSEKVTCLLSNEINLNLIRDLRN
jgi:hypothetical protein